MSTDWPVNQLFLWGAERLRDFFVVVTARCRILYVFVVMEVGTAGHEAGPHAPG